MKTNYIEQAIRKAFEGGWLSDREFQFFNTTAQIADINTHFRIKVRFYRKNGFVGTKWWEIADQKSAFLDSSFWIALGKVLGWDSNYRGKFIMTKHAYNDVVINHLYPAWEYQWHLFIRHLAEGKDPNDYFKEILTTK